MMMGHSLRNPRMNSYVSWTDIPTTFGYSTLGVFKGVFEH